MRWEQQTEVVWTVRNQERPMKGLDSPINPIGLDWRLHLESPKPHLLVLMSSATAAAA